MNLPSGSTSSGFKAGIGSLSIMGATVLLAEAFNLITLPTYILSPDGAASVVSFVGRFIVPSSDILTIAATLAFPGIVMAAGGALILASNRKKTKKLGYSVVLLIALGFMAFAFTAPAFSATYVTQSREVNQYAGLPYSYYVQVVKGTTTGCNPTCYIAQNGTTSAIDYGGPGNAGGASGASAQAVIESTVGSGLKVVLGVGTFTLTSGLTAIASSATINGFTLTGASGDYGSTILNWSGSTGGTVLNMSGTIYSTVSNIDFRCASTNAAYGITLQSAGAYTSYQNTLDHVLVETCGSTDGILIGHTTNNVQSSEQTLNQVAITGSTGNCLAIYGQNSLNIRAYGLKATQCGVGTYITGGNLVAYDTLFSSSTTEDINIGAPARPVAFYGGDSEGSPVFLNIGYNANHFSYEIDSFYVYPSSAGATVVSDNSLYMATFIDDTFGNGAIVSFGGGSGTPSLKLMVNPEWSSSGSSAKGITPQWAIFNPSTGNIDVRIIGYNGSVIAKPFNNADHLMALTAANGNWFTVATNATTYYQEITPAYVSCSGGTLTGSIHGITFATKSGTSLNSWTSCASMGLLYVPVGYSLTFNWHVAPSSWTVVSTI